MTPRPTTTERVRAALSAPVDAAGLAAFRILYGLLLFVGLIRFLRSGWIDRFYGQPGFFFKYWPLPVDVPPVALVTGLYAALAALALLVAVGLFYRVAAALLCVGFAYAQLFDVTNYLNHHYLVVLLTGLCACMPLHAAWSIDAWRRPALRRAELPALHLWVLRAQVATVYFYAGLAKAHPDWLLEGQPLATWFLARGDLPMLGPLLTHPWAPLAASWAAFLYDTTIWAWLSWRRTRLYAYIVVLTFHTLTHVFFNIGMFPFIMTVAALVFFPPGWPRRLLRLAPAPPPGLERRPVGRPALALAAAYLAIQVLVPLRHLAYPGDVLWNEEGMRFAWKVMLREKHGSVTFLVGFPGGKVLEVPPRHYLTHRQEREMAGQPDLILQLARHIGREYERAGKGPVSVRAHALVSLNGRPPQLLIDPERDLMKVHDSLANKDWILPGPTDAPRAAAVAAR